MNFTLASNKINSKMTLVKGSVTITVGNSAEVELEFPELRKKTADEIFDIKFWDDTLTVKEKFGRKSHMMPPLFDEKLNTNLVLKLPANTEASGYITAVGGNIDMGAIHYDGKLKTLNGDMNLGDMRSDDLNINTVSGDTRIGTINGSLVGNAISGAFLVEAGELSYLSLKSVSGDIYVKSGFNLEQDSYIQTVSGDINMNIPHYKTEKELSLSTLSGNTKLEGTYPEDKIRKKRSMPFMKGSPFKEFMPMMKEFMHSMKGGRGVEVHTKWHSSNKSKNVETILNMLAEGKITADEAERLINAIKGK